MSLLIPSRLSRRDALTRMVMAAGAATIQCRQALQAEANGSGNVTFYVVADPQIHLEKWGTAGTEATIRTINSLPGKPFPLGGMKVV